jgi:hypothetical protein
LPSSRGRRGCRVLIEVSKDKTVSPLDGVPDVTAGLHQPESNGVVGIELDADRSRNVCERVFDPRFVLCLGLPEAGGRVMLRLVVDLLVVDTAQQDQILVSVDHVGRAFAIAGAGRRARCDVSLVADNGLPVARCSLGDKDPATQRTSVT